MTVLVIDDDKDINILAATALKAFGYTVYQAYNGFEGLKIAEKECGNINLIILDIMMPDIDGIQVLKKLKENDKTKPIPVIFLSARVMDEDIRRISSLFEDFISKPFDLNSFIKTVENIAK
jgi:CheY-like chemotaxis protein